MLDNLVKGVEKCQNGTCRVTPYSLMKTLRGRNFKVVWALGKLKGKAVSGKDGLMAEMINNVILVDFVFKAVLERGNGAKHLEAKCCGTSTKEEK